MLIVNTTYHVAESCATAWLTWVRTTYTPAVSQTGQLVNPRLYRLLVENEPGTIHYALQFEVSDLSTLETWFETVGKKLQDTMTHAFHQDVLGFTTLMENQPLDQ